MKSFPLNNRMNGDMPMAVGSVTTGPIYTGSDEDTPTAITIQPSNTPNTGISDTLEEGKRPTGASENDIDSDNTENANKTKKSGPNVAADIADVMLQDDYIEYIDDDCYDDDETSCTICAKVFVSGETYWKCDRLSCTNRIRLCEGCYHNVDPSAQVMEHRNHMIQKSKGDTGVGDTARAVGIAVV